MNELSKVYNERIIDDFPRNERRPLFAMERLMRAGQYDCYGYYDGDALLAYACFILARGGSYSLLDYFAVDCALRGRGIGSEFLQKLKENTSAAKGVLIEAESPDTAKTQQERMQRERRIRFYLANGAELTGSKCLLFGVDYTILFLAKGAAGSIMDAEQLHMEVQKLYQELYAKVYGRLCKPYI